MSFTLGCETGVPPTFWLTVSTAGALAPQAVTVICCILGRLAMPLLAVATTATVYGPVAVAWKIVDAPLAELSVALPPAGVLTTDQANWKVTWKRDGQRESASDGVAVSVSSALAFREVV